MLIILKRQSSSKRSTKPLNHITKKIKAPDASMEVPKLHNIKLLIAFIHIHQFHDEHLILLYAGITGKLNEWVMIDHDCFVIKNESSSLKFNGCIGSSLLTLAASIRVQS